MQQLPNNTVKKSPSPPPLPPFPPSPSQLCFTINYVMGTGFLTLPWSFASSGLLLSLITMFLVGCISNVSKDWILNAMARAEAIESKAEEEKSATSKTSLLPSPPHTHTPLPLVSTRKYELVSLCSLFLPLPGSLLYTLTFSLYMYGTLWAYTSVFSNAMVSALPIGTKDDYLLYTVGFAVVTIPLTCVELREQVKVQVTLSICRMLLVTVILASVIAAWKEGGPDQFDEVEGPQGIPMFDFTGFYKLLPIAVYANIYHHSIPGLSHPVADKSKLGRIFQCVFIVMGVCYVAIGSVVGWYFGVDIESSCNIQWHDYLSGTGECTDNCAPGSDDKVWSGRSWWVSTVSFYVVLFPALDVLSAFPLNGITLGNCLLGQYHGGNTRYVEGVRKKVVPFRILASVPSILGATVVRDLGTITDYTGVTGFVIAFVFPAVLNLRSRREAKRRGVGGETGYEGWGSGDGASWAGMVFGGFMVVFVLGSLIWEAA